jgi:hypothetical protein
MGDLLNWTSCRKRIGAQRAALIHKSNLNMGLMVMDGLGTGDSAISLLVRRVNLACRQINHAGSEGMRKR